jgi:hypothetical protein
MNPLAKLQPGCKSAAIAFSIGVALFVLSSLVHSTAWWRVGWLLAAMVCSFGALSAGYALQKREQPLRLAWAALVFNLLLPAGVLVSFLIMVW